MSRGGAWGGSAAGGLSWTAGGTCAGIEIGRVEAEAEDVGLFARGPMAVGEGDDGAIGQDLHAWVGAIEAVVVVGEPDPVLAGPAVADVLVAADPGDPIALGGGRPGDIAEGDEEATISEVAGDVSIAGEAFGEFDGGRPGAAFIA